MRAMRRVATLGLATLVLGLWASCAYASPLFSKVPGETVEGRYTPTAALLPNGKVLIAGGFNELLPENYLRLAELFNPATGTFEKLPAEMTVARDEQASVALPGGKVLIVGGFNAIKGQHYLKSVELFNSETNTFEAVAPEMKVARDGPGAALLPNGKVLIVGGATSGGVFLKSAELYDPAGQTFETFPAEMSVERYQPAAVTLPNGKVLIAGGFGAGSYLKTAELFNPETNTFESLKARRMN